MKKYKTWQAIKMLTENPKLEFKASESRLFKEDGGYIVLENYNGDLANGFDNCFTGNEEWALVQEPVDFMTAVKSGKRIKVEHEAIKHFELKCTFEYLTLFVVVEELAKHLDSISLREVLTEGKFYIED